jgi:hypothetical protein
MGAKVSLLAANNKKRIANSLHHMTKSKTYNMDSNDISQQQKNTSSATLDEKNPTQQESDSRVSSVTDSSMFSSGRTFHHVANSAYWFPNDDEEMDRLIGVRGYSFVTDVLVERIIINAYFLPLFPLKATLCIKNFV